MYTLVNLLLQLERRKKNNLLSEEISRIQLLSYFFTTTIFFEKKKILGTNLSTIATEHWWLNNTLHFVFRACTERRNLSWGDAVLETDGQGKEYIVHSERQTKNRQGENSRNVRPVKPVLFT